MMGSHALTIVPIVGEARPRVVALRHWQEESLDSDEVRVRVEVDGHRFEAASEIGYFRALAEVRRQLEELGLWLRCNGSCLNVYPSPMIEAMGGGDRAYVLTMGKPAVMSDLVSIFDYRDDLNLANVADQEEFYRKWLRSLG